MYETPADKTYPMTHTDKHFKLKDMEELKKKKFSKKYPSWSRNPTNLTEKVRSTLNCLSRRPIDI